MAYRFAFGVACTLPSALRTLPSARELWTHSLNRRGLIRRFASLARDFVAARVVLVDAVLPCSRLLCNDRAGGQAPRERTGPARSGRSVDLVER